MADTDSFIEEVSEEVRRDKLFAFFRRWGWAFGLVVVILVGGAAYNEYRKAQVTRAATDLGDAIIAALDAEDPAARADALAEIATEDTGAEMLLTLLLAGQESEAGDVEAAAARLREVANRTDMPERYRDLAELKAHMLFPLPSAEALVVLDRLSEPGAPYRALAVEQTAYLMITDGDTEGGMALLEDLLSEAGTTPALQERVRQLMVALQSGASLTDEPLPEPDLGALDALPDLPVGEVAPEDDGSDADPEAAEAAPASE